MNDPSTSALRQFLDRLTSRSVLSAEERQAVLDLPCQAAKVQSNYDIVTLGEKTEHSCLVAAGLVGRFGQNAEGYRQITAFHIPGDMADLHSVVQPVAGSALQSLSTATVVRIPHRSIRAIAFRHPGLAEAFWRDCMVDATILSQWVINVGRRDARKRISHLLCEIAFRLGAAPSREAVTFSFPATQSQLADATGLTAVHVNRTLMGLRSDGLANISERTVHIPDWKALVNAGEFDPSYLQAGVSPHDRIDLSAVG